jgi:1-pyrroline-5-carboxylate dehydrogenase
MICEFKNEPYLDFKQRDIQADMFKAIELVYSERGKEYPLVIGGERIRTEEKLDSIDPSSGEVLGTVQKASALDASSAIEVALKAFETWRWIPIRERAAVLFKAAKIMRERRMEFMAWMILEVGKSWVEADADIAEAIDFCEFYGREMIRLGSINPVTSIEGELSELKYIPLGVAVVIPPWNFPMAILVGMTVAALVAGNTVVLKPSSDAPLVAYKFFEVMEEAGIPKGVLNYLSGSGAVVGISAVKHPKTRLIAFTGSKEVGLEITQAAAEIQEGQQWIKRVIAEMGGKDFIIVDDEADLKEAVKGVTTSAFGYQGQKCSACSRVIVIERIYDEFLELFRKETEKISVGPVKDPKNWMGPVINKRAQDSILEYIEIGKNEGNLIIGGKKIEREGFFIQPTIIADVNSKARIAQEEIFGPVCAVIKAKDINEAIEVANDTEYGLTGSVYTKNRSKIAQTRRKLHVGNLYFNRKCTGALVGVHPFGGFNMSGTDSKAGGKDYLLLFTQAKSISEKF